MKYFFIFLPIPLFFAFLSACSHSKDLQIIRSANEAHYNLTASGLKSFSCKISVKEINEMSEMLQDINPNDDKRAAIKDYIIATLKKMQILATINGDGYVSVELLNDIDTGDEKLDKGFERFFKGAKEITSSFLAIWGNITFQPLFPNKDLDYKISSNSNYYFVAFTEDNINVIAKLTKTNRLTEFTNKTVEDDLSYKTNFINTEKGYLLKSYKIRVINDSDEVNTEIEYQQIEGFFLPETVRILHKLKTGPVEATLFFSDYKLDKY